MFTYNESKAIDTLAFIKIHNATVVDPHTMEFELTIQRNSNTWLKFANATFQLAFKDTNFKFNKSNMDLTLFETELPGAILTGELLPSEGYLVEPKVFDNRLSITVLGPPKFDDCTTVPRDTSVLVGKLRVQTKDGRQIPEKLSWLRPLPWYQGSAFKLAQDSIIDNVIRYFYSDDNVSMEDRVNVTYVFIDDNSKQKFEFDNMWVTYTGQFADSIVFRTKSEFRVAGYTIKRGIRSDLIDLKYTDTIFTYLPGKYFNPDMISKGYSSRGFTYGAFFDTVQYRGGQYCYSLHATMVSEEGLNYDTLLAERCITVPNSVIVQGDASPNPFSSSTTINYTLDDDVYLTVSAYDVIGKKIKDLTDPGTGKVLDKLFMKKGSHSTIFEAPELASQGLYNIVLLANPIKDPSIEFSRAIVKVQLIKDGSR